MEVKATFKTNANDNAKFSIYSNRKFFIVMPIALTIFCLCLTYLIYHEIDDFQLLIFIIGAILLIPLLMLVVLLKSNSSFKSNAFNNMQAKMTFNDDGISQSSEIGNTTLPYNKIYKIREVKSAFYLYISKSQVMDLQKRYFTCPEDIQTVKTLFTKHIGKKKLKLRK